jgi:predicted peptidase
MSFDFPAMPSGAKILWRLFLLGLSLAVLMPATTRADDYIARTFSDGGKTLPYRLFVPKGYDASKKYPVILFFHGAGERGTDNNAQLAHVAPVFVTPEFQAAHPCFVIAPQCPPDQQWVDMPWGALSGVRPAQPSQAMQLALKILDAVESEFSIDHDRVYAAGLSMGGYAVWDCITRFPERFAAGAACCGGGDENTVTAEVARVPVWAFHSADDTVVPVVRSQHMIAAMKKMGGQPKYSEYQGLGHGSWDKAFSEPDLYPWLFSQSLSKRLGDTP